MHLLIRSYLPVALFRRRDKDVRIPGTALEIQFIYSRSMISLALRVPFHYRGGLEATLLGIRHFTSQIRRQPCSAGRSPYGSEDHLNTAHRAWTHLSSRSQSSWRRITGVLVSPKLSRSLFVLKSTVIACTTAKRNGSIDLLSSGGRTHARAYYSDSNTLLTSR